MISISMAVTCQPTNTKGAKSVSTLVKPYLNAIRHSSANSPFLLVQKDLYRNRCNTIFCHACHAFLTVIVVLYGTLQRKGQQVLNIQFLLNWIQSRCSFLELSKWKILSHLSLKKIFVWIHQISIFGQEKWLVNFVFLVLPSMFYFRRWRRLLCKNFWVCWLCGGNRTWHLHKMLELRNHLPAAASPLTTFLSEIRVALLA